jgi:hypothetical protein
MILSLKILRMELNTKSRIVKKRLVARNKISSREIKKRKL